MQLKQWIAVFMLLSAGLNSGTMRGQNAKLVYDTVTTKNGTILAPYKSGELVIDFTGATASQSSNLRGFLKEHHLRRDMTYSCPCNEKLEIWVADDPELDLIGVVEGAKGQADGVGGRPGMSINFQFDNFEHPAPSTTTKSFTVANPHGPTVKVAVLDSGVDPNTENPLLSEALRKHTGNGCQYTKQGQKLIFKDTKSGIDVASFNVNGPIDLHGHGTHVNGILAGVPEALDPANNGVLRNNNVRIELINVKITEGKSNSGFISNAICGLYYAAQNEVQIFNLSWGFMYPESPKSMVPFLAWAKDHNLLIVAGAGNDSTYIDSEAAVKFWPAEFHKGEFKDNVISVGAYTEEHGNKIKLKVSNWGNADVFAPGGNILSTYWRKKLIHNSGTSMATPFVTRTAALIIGSHPGIQAKEVKKCIVSSGIRQRSGHGPQDPPGLKPPINAPQHPDDMNILNMQKAILCNLKK